MAVHKIEKIDTHLALIVKKAGLLEELFQTLYKRFDLMADFMTDWAVRYCNLVRNEWGICHERVVSSV